MPRFLRRDKGTEIGKMSTLHAFLEHKAEIMEDAVDSIIYGLPHHQIKLSAGGVTSTNGLSDILKST